MLRLIRFLIIGSWHEHKYEIIDVHELRNSDGIYGELNKMQCNECGHVKYKSYKNWF